MKPAYPLLAVLLACGGATSSQMDAETDVTTQDADPFMPE